MIAFFVTLAFAEPPQPPDGIELPVRVAAALRVEQVAGIDEVEDTFDGTVDIVLRWRDPNNAFDRTRYGTDRREFSGADADAQLATMWTPGVVVANLAGDPAARDAGLRLFDDGRVEYVQRIHGTFDTPLDLARFPFDDQRLTIALTVPDYSVADVVLVHREEDHQRSGLAAGLGLPEWQIGSIGFEASEARAWNGVRSSRMEAWTVATRRAEAYVPSLFAPLGVILLLPLLSIWVNTDVHERINWVVTAGFALIALNFSVSVEYPALGVDSTFMRLFWYGYAAQGLTLGFIMILFNEDSIAAWLGEDITDEALRYLKWSFPALMFVAVADVIASIVW